MDCTPFWDVADTITCHAEAAVVGCRLVSISGPRVDGNPQVSHTAAGEEAFGVASRDKLAGEKVMVHRAPTIVAPIEAGAVLAAGDKVQAGAGGTVIVLAAGKQVGVAMDDCPLGGLAVIDRTARG